jgi:hypothetical protein
VALARHSGLLAPCVAFVLLGIALAGRAGLEADEVLFARPVFRPGEALFRIPIFHHYLPIMVMPYIGTLKTFLWWPILRLFGPGISSIRFPAVFVGAITLLLFYGFCQRVASRSVAVIACALLATDPTFILTGTFDWGPVGLEHFLLVGGCLAFVCGRPALGSFLFGLALWNKAVFLWALSGLAAGAVAAFWPEVRKCVLGPRLLLRLSCAFLAGAIPFVVYNIRRPNATLGSSARISSENLKFKFRQLRVALDGSGLRGFISGDASSFAPAQTAPPKNRWSGWFQVQLENRRTTLFPYAVVLAVLSTPFWWRTPFRAAGLFALVFSTVTFSAMLFSQGGGMGVHHTVLLWPMPHLLVAVALSVAPARSLRWPVAILLIGANFLMIRQYFLDFDRSGCAWRFTDATNRLSSTLADAGTHVFVTDWGIYEILEIMHRGKLEAFPVYEIFLADSADPARADLIHKLFSDPRGLFVRHTPAFQAFPAAVQHFDADLKLFGYEKTAVQTFADSHGRPMLEIFRVKELVPPPEGR